MTAVCKQTQLPGCHDWCKLRRLSAEVCQEIKGRYTSIVLEISISKNIQTCFLKVLNSLTNVVKVLKYVHLLNDFDAFWDSDIRCLE